MIALARPDLRKLHAVSSMLAILIIGTFLTSTLVAELSQNIALIVGVKQGIAYGLAVLAPTMAAVGLSGTRLAGASTAPVIQRKRRRTAIIAANGLFILLPCALVLAWLATTGNFGPVFYVVQGIELVVGTVNITLLVLNARLGMSMARKVPRRE